MRITLVNHGTASEWGGGDGVQIRETGVRLRQRGHQVEIQNSDRPVVNDADIVHIFNCRVHDSFRQQIASCHEAGVHVVVSPIWISIGKALWGSRGTFGVLQKAVREGIPAAEKDLKMLEGRQLKVQLAGGLLDSEGAGNYDLSWIDEVRRQLSTVSGLLPNSWIEMNTVQADLRWRGEKYNVAHYGVNPAVFLDPDPEPFRRFTGIRGPFVLQAGRIEAGKNQAMLCWALKETRIPIVLIGSSKHWPAYADLCREIGGDRLTIIDHLPQDLLASAYAAASVHCLASWMDTCGLVSLEAGLSGTPVVGSTFGHELEYLKGDAWLADPACAESILRAVQSAWESGKHCEKSKRLKARILTSYNWENTATATESLYREVIGSA